MNRNAIVTGGSGPSASPFMLSFLLSELGGSGLHSAAKNATAAPLLAVAED